MNDEVSLLSLVNWSWLHLIIPIIAVQRVFELRRSARNEACLRAKGAVESGAEQYASIVALHVLWFIGMIAEIIMLSRQVVALWPVLLGIFLLAEALRTWAISSLGRRWSTRVLVIPTSRPLRNGPYRWLRHPNYIAVAVELAVVPLMLGAVVTAITVTILNGLIIRRRIVAEDRALEQARAAPPQDGGPYGPGNALTVHEELE